MRTYRERFWDVICVFSGHAYVLFAVSVSLLLLTVFSLYNVDPGTSAYLLSQISLVILACNVLVLTWIIRRCRSRE